jgi:hypothetical protein
MRVIITGGPKTGKTTMARSAVATVSRWLDRPGPWVIEGVTGVRALRHWLRGHQGQKPPVDRVIYLRTPYVPLSKGQANMAKGVETVWQQILPELRRWHIDIQQPR